jgi:cytochrome b involved in lipid metabolism
MKKTFTAFALALVLSVVVAPESSAAVKAGATCKKAGLISITGGLKYTCVKKSGKLTWSKGVAVKPSAKPSVTAKPSVAPVSYTMAQVSANKSAAKCWSVINGNVYDLTAWINAHPGGAGAITSLCGIDGTQDFLAMHRNQSKPESRLSAFLLGPLAK